MGSDRAVLRPATREVSVTEAGSRVGAPDVPVPLNDRLERSVIPSAERIVAAVKGLFGEA